MFRQFLRVAAIASCLSAVLGPNLLAQSASSPRYGGTLNVGMEADFPTLDPLGMGALAERQVGMAVYDTLLEIDEKGAIRPGLAEKFLLAPDARSVTLTLRSGVKFHDGTPFDAEAVVFNFKRLRDPANKCRCSADLASLADVVALGPLEVEFRFSSPSSHFLSVLADVAGLMISPTAVSKLDKGYGQAPVGTGPFMYKEWRKGNYFHAVRNPDYWRKGLPYLNDVFYRPMPDDQTRQAALAAGNIDISLVPAARDVAAAIRDKSFKVIDPGGLGTVFVMISWRADSVQDPRVRQALAYATDRAALNKAINRGIYKLARTPFGSGLFPHEKVEGFREFDLKKAQALVREVGKPVKVKLSVTASPNSIQTAQALQQMWKKAGIETEIDQQEQVQLIRNAINNNFEIMIFRWPGRADPDANVYQFFHSKSMRNYTRYSDPGMDKALEAGRVAVDQTERLKHYSNVNDILARDVVYHFLHYYTPFMLAGKNVEGIPLIPDGLLRSGFVWKGP